METVSIEQKQAAERVFAELATSFGLNVVGGCALVLLSRAKSIEFCTMIFDAAMVHLAGTNHGDWLKVDYKHICKRIKGEVK